MAETEGTTPEAETLSDGQVIAQRQADNDAKTADEFVKVFVHGPGPKPTEGNGTDHAANKAATREFALQAGLRPTGDVSHVSTKQNRDGVAWDLTYSVPVILSEKAEPSRPDFVLQGEPAPANSEGNGKTGDTRGKLTA